MNVYEILHVYVNILNKQRSALAVEGLRRLVCLQEIKNDVNG